MRDLGRERLLSVMTTKVYTQFDAEELVDLYNELVLRMGSIERSREANDVSLVEMYFFVCCFLGRDQEADLVFKRLRDRFGDSSPRIRVMKATLLEINENDGAAMGYLENLLRGMEYDADSTSYLMLSKKLLSIKLRNNKKNEVQMLKDTLAVIEKFPLDPELQWMCAELYASSGELTKAAFCIEEVILAMPFNYVAFARLAELHYYRYLREFGDKNSKKRKEGLPLLERALQNALRSVELSELFLKGWTLVATISKELENKSQLLAMSKSKLEEISDVSNPNDSRIAKKFLQKLF
ncbi:hypothetical protein RNJ44_01562 [Nakaseomyces bracarensis]|uniref:ER membrane protein complex subunit 2 n=1 Tax=Nakaseomyces bracarensis TaxID=273131 RepID=A0ABR4NQ30_9SACH